MRKLLITLLLLLGLAAPVYAEGTASVTALDTQCTVERDGACTVTLQVRIRPEGAESFVIPVSASAAEIQVVGASYTLEPGADYTGVRLELDSYRAADVTVSYRLAETVTDNGSEQVFDVVLLHPAWACPIESYELTIRLPEAFTGLPVFESGYYRDLIDNYMDVRINGGVIHAVLNSKQTLRDHEQITMRLNLPAGYFDLRFLAGKTAKVDRLLFFMLLVLTLAFWAVLMRNFPILPKRQAMPPEGGNAGEIPFLLTRQKPDLALMVIQWASLGYLTIHRNKKGRIVLYRQIDMDNERKRCEVEVFRCLFSRSDLCDTRSAEYGKAKKLAVDQMRDYWQDRIYSKKAGSPLIFRLLAIAAGVALCVCCSDLALPPRSWRWFAILPLSLAGGAACFCLQRLSGILLRRQAVRTGILCVLSLVYLLVLGSKGGCGKLMLLCIALQLLVGLLLRLGGKRTKDGDSQAAELLGFRRYLISTPSAVLQGHLQTDPQYFYRVLPFADALQAGSFLAGSFDRIKLEPCDWLVWEGKPMLTVRGFYRRYCRLMAALRGEREPLRFRLGKAMSASARTGGIREEA